MYKRKDFLEEYGVMVKYSLIIAGLFFMIIAIRAYLNFVATTDAIAEVESQVESMTQETAFNEHFMKPYLDSQYATFFVAHENNKLAAKELLVEFTSPQMQKDGQKLAQQAQEHTGDQQILSSETEQLSPPAAWSYFLQ